MRQSSDKPKGLSPLAAVREEKNKKMKREHIFAHYEQDATRYWELREGGYATPLSVCQGTAGL